MNNIANLNVLIIQNYVIDYDFDNNCKEIIKLIDKSMLNNKNKNIIICLPEYCWTGYIEKNMKIM
jgi:predicted amidohydrolase